MRKFLVQTNSLLDQAEGVLPRIIHNRKAVMIAYGVLALGVSVLLGGAVTYLASYGSDNTAAQLSDYAAALDPTLTASPTLAPNTPIPSRVIDMQPAVAEDAPAAVPIVSEQPTAEPTTTPTPYFVQIDPVVITTTLYFVPNPEQPGTSEVFAWSNDDLMACATTAALNNSIFTYGNGTGGCQVLLNNRWTKIDP